ncbi:hypothetical protein GCM10023085_41010 [Actinomadura viridis]
MPPGASSQLTPCPQPVITAQNARLMVKILDRPDIDRWAVRAALPAAVPKRPT